MKSYSGFALGGGRIASLLIGAGLVVAPSVADRHGGAWAAEEQPRAQLQIPLPPSVDRLAILSEMRPKGRAVHIASLTREALARGLPPDVADAVARVESGYDPDAVGGVGEVGIMQIRPSTARMLGHRGSLAELFVPEVNIRLGVTYLAKAWELARGDLCGTLMKYRAGHGENRMTALSVAYCRRARDHLAAIGSPLANAVVPPAAQAVRAGGIGTSPSAVALPTPNPARAVPAMASTALQERARRLWAEHVARVKGIDAKIDRIMSGG